MIVADASAVVDLLLRTSEAPHITARLTAQNEPAAAPDLLDVEVMSVLRRWERNGDLDAERAEEALDDLEVLPITRHPARVVARSAWKLRHTLTAYGAQYVALAHLLGATLITTDARMARAARALGVDVV